MPRLGAQRHIGWYRQPLTQLHSHRKGASQGGFLYHSDAFGTPPLV